MCVPAISPLVAGLSRVDVPGGLTCKGPLDEVAGGNPFVPPAVTFEAEGMKGAPDVTARFEIRDGVPEVVDFRITAKLDGRAVCTAEPPCRGLLAGYLRTKPTPARCNRRSDGCKG